MKINYLEVLAAQQGKKRPLWLLRRLHAALHMQLNDQTQWPEKAQRWWDLLRFCAAQQSIAIWLCDEQAALQRIQGLADLAGQSQLAHVLSEALQGEAQENALVTFSALGEPDLTFALRDEAAQVGGIDWSATDLAIELEMPEFAAVIAELLFADIADWYLPAPAEGFDLFEQDATQSTDSTANNEAQSAPESLRLLLANSNALELGTASIPAVLVNVEHVLQTPADADLHAFYQVFYQSEAPDLVATTHLHGGANLFQVGETVGLQLFAPDQWPAQQEAMLARARQHTWADAAEQIPTWLASALAFAQTPEDAEFWIMPTQGDWAGCVLLSETDVLNHYPRFASVDAFFAALLEKPEMVLNASGYLRYLHQGSLLPVKQG